MMTDHLSDLDRIRLMVGSAYGERCLESLAVPLLILVADGRAGINSVTFSQLETNGVREGTYCLLHMQDGTDWVGQGGWWDIALLRALSQMLQSV